MNILVIAFYLLTGAVALPLCGYQAWAIIWPVDRLLAFVVCCAMATLSFGALSIGIGKIAE